MEKNKKLLTIGQFASLHSINKKTLMWYDEIGLFHPAFIHPQNGYRYYSYEQSPVLETILLLRELNLPISEIQDFMKNRCASSMEQLMQEKIEDIDRNIAHLKALRKTLSYHCQNMQTLLTMDLSKIGIVQKKARSLVTVDINRNTTFDKQVEIISAERKKYQLCNLHDFSYGTMITVDSDELHIQPAGNYVRAFYRDAAESPELCYQRIFDYVKEHGLVLSGFSYEAVININVIDQIEDSLVQIEIPVKSK